MDIGALEALIDGVRLPGWKFTVEHADRHVFVRVAAAADPADTRMPGVFDGLSESFVVPASWDQERVERRIFATWQFLTDHEGRENFMVHGRRPFDAHDPSVTGEQHDWWVEHESAVRGY